VSPFCQPACQQSDSCRVIIWLDAQLSPGLALWITETIGTECLHVRNLGLRDAEDSEIFQKARAAGAVVMTKDEDFIRLVERNGTPPQVIWVTSGNMSNARFKILLLKTFPDAISLIESGESIVEIHKRAGETAQ
jgi:predicted nuclease of predicted toxin-antitoxin system